MTESPRIEGLLRRIRREIRRRRAEYYGLRGAFWGAVAGVAVMLAKQGIGARAPWIAGGLVVLGLLVGLAYGAARGIRRGDVARVADRAFGLDDRVATTLEWADRPDRTRPADTLVDAAWLADETPDLNSFMTRGDERRRMLEQTDRTPDLQSDFTNSQYKMVYRKSKALTGGLRPDQISPQKLRELLEEMERLGRKGGGNWSGDAMEGMEALEGGQSDRALEAMQKALDKMRAMDEAQRSGKGLRGGRESERGGRGKDRARGDGMGPEDQDFGEGEGLMPGKGRSGNPKGEATQRLRANPFDVGVEGESRRGRKEGYDTNLTGRGGSMASRLQYLGVIGQYRKQMEDAITREQVPRDFHDQIRSYFQALDER